MKININRKKVSIFSELQAGDLFIVKTSDSVFMKLVENGYNRCNGPNTVELNTGTLMYSSSTDILTRIDDAKLECNL